MFLSRFRFCRLILVAAVVNITCGCAMTLEERASLAAASMQNTRAEATKVSSQIDATVAALNDLVGNPQANLKPQFVTFSTAVDGLKAQAEVTRMRVDEMREKGVAYYDAWEQDPDAPVSPTLKASYDKVSEESKKARDAFNPFLDSLVDIKRLLRLDLSATGIGLVQDLAKKANSEAQEVKQRLQAATDELDTIANLIAPPPKAP